MFAHQRPQQQDVQDQEECRKQKKQKKINELVVDCEKAKEAYQPICQSPITPGKFDSRLEGLIEYCYEEEDPYSYFWTLCPSSFFKGSTEIRTIAAKNRK
jgi:hypothetical protein